MTCAEFRELAALYVLGALSPEERAAADAHLAEPTHDGCFEALHEAARGTEAVARSLIPVRPDDALWGRIAGRLERPARRGMPVRERLAWAVAGFAFVLLIAFTVRARRDHAAQADRLATVQAGARQFESEREACRRELASLRGEADAQKTALALLQSPSTRVVALAPPKGQPTRSARALLDLEHKQGILVSASLEPQQGRDYELWVIRGDQKIAAGLLRAGSSGAVIASIDAQLLSGAPPDAVAVTLEPAGGMPQPTGTLVLVGSLHGS